MLLFFSVVAFFSTLFPCPHCPLFVSTPCLLAHVLPVLTHSPICAFQFVSPPYLLTLLTYPPICAIQFVSPPHLLTCSTPCPDLPTHLCLSDCESPLLAHLLPVLTFPFILAFQFVSAPCLDCSLACICTIFLCRNAHSYCSHMYCNTPLQ